MNPNQKFDPESTNYRLPDAYGPIECQAGDRLKVAAQAERRRYGPLPPSKGWLYNPPVRTAMQRYASGKPESWTLSVSPGSGKSVALSESGAVSQANVTGDVDAQPSTIDMSTSTTAQTVKEQQDRQVRAIRNALERALVGRRADDVSAAELIGLAYNALPADATLDDVLLIARELSTRGVGE